MEAHILAVGESAKHRHGQNINRGNNTGYIPWLAGFSSYNEEHPIHQGEGAWFGNNPVRGSNIYSQIMTDDSGAGQPHNNVSPCLASYIWRRIA